MKKEASYLFFSLQLRSLPCCLLLSCMLFASCTQNREANYEQSALRFLYDYMPLSDSIDHDAHFYLTNIRAARQAAKEMPWGSTIPEPIFRHFVLPVRVNNEHLDSARTVFYHELKERVRHLSMADAILEVNHWCHEKAVYQPTDARTSSPLATVRTAYGRCGEESTFLVAALRSVAIPARQVYTPRWAHTDDNHAWVEAWADGQWYFLGACEPEPVLNLGWFNAPASRGMLMNAKVFGHYDDDTEEVLSISPNTTEVNVTAHYAPISQAIVSVKDESGNPVLDARVEFKLYNYAEFYTVASKQTDTHGNCSLTAGRGDMLVWASKNGRFGFVKLSFGKQKQVTVVLNKQEGDLFAEEFDIVPPPETANLPVVTPEQRALNDRRMAQEDAIRHAYEATMLTHETAAAFVHTLDYKWDTDQQPGQLTELLVASRGNHAVLEQFLKQANMKKNAWMLLKSLSAKDLRDVRIEVLNDHLSAMNRSEAPLIPHIYSPRISVEELTPYRSFFAQAIDAETANAYRQDPQKLIEWCRQNITLANARNTQRVPVSPAGVWRSRLADTRSRNIFFVAVARSLYIPAWIDNVTGKVCYQRPEDESGAVYNVDFEKNEAQVQPTGRLIATYTPTALLDNPKYEHHFTLSKIERGRLHLQNYSGSWESLLKRGIQVPTGYYMLTTGTRLANGSVLARVSSFVVGHHADTRTSLVMRQDKNRVAVIGSFNSESLFTPLGSNTRQSLLQACGRGYFVVGVLGVGQEPTNHALRDIAALQADLEQWGRKLVLLFPDRAQADKFRRDDFKGLPDNVIYGIDSDGIGAQIIDNMKLKPETLPLFIIADTFNRVVFVSQGYTIGLGEQLMKTVRGL
ncbi:MAG: transglutaminase-like domain-containing protein [Prevotellaceae bacterium]|nr:transglutaminase-like domain-containing protein [Prevotellaceae bacterium]